MIAPKLINAFGVAACVGTAALLVHVTVSDKGPAGSALLGPQTVQAVPGEGAGPRTSIRGARQERQLAADLSSGDRLALDQATLPDPYVGGLDQEAIVILSQDSDATGGQYASADVSGGSTILFGSNDESVWRSYSGSTDLASAAIAGGSTGGSGFSTGGSSGGGSSAGTGDLDFADGDADDAGDDLIVIPIGGDTDAGGETTPADGDASDDDPLSTGDDPFDIGDTDDGTGTSGTGDGETGDDAGTTPDDGGQDAATPDDGTQDPDTGTTGSGGSIVTPRPDVRDNTTRSIEQFGITWTFDKPVSFVQPEAGEDVYYCGRFANDDYWVVGPVNIIGIDPPSTADTTGRIKNGSMLDPEPGPYHAYDSSWANGWVAELNVAYGVSESSPLVIAGGHSLVSSISMEDPTARPRVKTAAVLTVLSAAPAAGSFRPAYCDPDKTVRHNIADLQWSLLKNLQPVSSTPGLTTVERWFERPWIDHKNLWSADYIHPELNMPHYGRDMHERIGAGGLMLHLNFTQEQKETLLIRYIQLGIDFYGIAMNGGRQNWIGEGGVAGGRKWPILFAGIMLDNADMKAIGQKSGDYLWSGEYGPGDPPPDYIHFGEDDQTFYVAQFDVDITNSDQWNPDTRNPNCEPYDPSDIGTPEWAIRHATRPQQSDASWGATYRMTAGRVFSSTALCALIMDAKDVWNHNAYFDYTDRYMQHYEPGSPERRMYIPFNEQMWDRYRAEYPPLWSPMGEQE